MSDAQCGAKYLDQRCIQVQRHGGLHLSETRRWDNLQRLYCMSRYMGSGRCDQPLAHDGDHSNPQAQWGRDVCGDRLHNGVPCQREPEHEGLCEGARRTAVKLDEIAKTVSKCDEPHPEFLAMRCTVADGVEHRTHEAGTLMWPVKETAPALTEERVNEAMTVLERRVMARLRQLASGVTAGVAALETRVEKLEGHAETGAGAPTDSLWWGQVVAQVNAKVTELVDRPDVSETLERLTQAVDLMSDKLLPTDAITAHVSRNVDTVLTALEELKAPQPVVYPYERSGVTVLGPDTYLHAGNWVIVHKGKSFYPEGDVQPVLRTCDATAFVADRDSLFFCQRSPGHLGPHRDAKQKGMETVSWGPEPAVVLCGNSDGDPWCEQAEHHDGDCDPEPEGYVSYGD